MGLVIGKGSYLRNYWNWLDFIVVIASLLQVIPSMKNISGLRTFRLFRPLRNLTKVPSMRTLVGTLLLSMSQLGGILSLAIFFFLIFAILGVNLWSGSIHYRCWKVAENGLINFNDTLSLPSPPKLCQPNQNSCEEGYNCASKLLFLIESNATDYSSGYE